MTEVRNAAPHISMGQIGALPCRNVVSPPEWLPGQVQLGRTMSQWLPLSNAPRSATGHRREGWFAGSTVTFTSNQHRSVI